MPRSDRELIEAWKRGDKAAGNTLVRRHFAVVYRFFVNKSAYSPEDLVQRTFLACLESYERFRGDSSFRTFLLGIARVLLLRQLRSAHGPERSFDDISVADTFASPSHVVAVRDEQAVLLQALRRLPVEMQITVELFYWEGLGVSEVAQILEIPPGTVKSRLNRARTLLRERIGKLQPSAARDATLESFDQWIASLKDLHSAGPSEPDEVR